MKSAEGIPTKAMAAAIITDRSVLNCIGQSLTRCAAGGGLYWEDKRGIALGCPLRPILGAFCLAELDAKLAKLGPFVVRSMDAILVQIGRAHV